MTAIAFLGFGLIVGSFLNVLVARWGREPLTGRSKCPSCGGTIAWHDLIPVLSWFLLQGHCRSCGARISIQYPLVETLTALLFFALGFSPLPLLEKVAALPIAALLVAIAVYDFRTTYIPNAWVYAFSTLSLASALIFSAAPEHIAAILLAGPITAAPLFALWFFSGGQWMGFGDVKLALGMGWLLGWGSGLSALFLGFLLGALVSAPLLFFSSEAWRRFTRTLTLALQSYVERGASGDKTPGTAISASSPFLLQTVMPKLVFGFTMKSEIAFGPFLIVATLIVWLANMYGFDILELALWAGLL